MLIMCPGAVIHRCVPALKMFAGSWETENLGPVCSLPNSPGLGVVSEVPVRSPVCGPGE